MIRPIGGRRYEFMDINELSKVHFVAPRLILMITKQIEGIQIILKWKSPYALQGQNCNFTKILIW